MNVVVRPADPRDAADIAEIHADGWRTGYIGLLPQFYLDSLQAKDVLPRWESKLATTGDWTRHLVAEQAGKVVGFVGYGACVDPDVPALPTPEGTPCGGWGEIWDMYVSEAARGTGVGSALIDAAVDALRHWGYSEVVVWCLHGNVRAEKFYTAKGFIPDQLVRTSEPSPGVTMRDDRWRLRFDS